jgi:hypothetical protein
MEDNSYTSFNDFDVDGCNISEAILFLQKLSFSPNASSVNVVFTKHITNALMKIREEKLKQKVYIPKKLEDGWDPIIDMNVNDFNCHALCDLGASISIMPSVWDIPNRYTSDVVLNQQARVAHQGWYGGFAYRAAQLLKLPWRYWTQALMVDPETGPWRVVATGPWRVAL